MKVNAMGLQESLQFEYVLTGHCLNAVFQMSRKCRNMRENVAVGL